MSEDNVAAQHAGRGKSALIAAAAAGVVAVLTTYLLAYFPSLDGGAVTAVPYILGIAAGITAGKQHARRHGGTFGWR